MIEIVIASRNEKKVREIKQITKGIPIKLLPLGSFKDLPEIIEGGKTFQENAKKKALTIANLTGKISLADDSGLEVEALNGVPGIESSRFAKTDKDRIDKLLGLMKDIPKEKRQAKFVCAVAIALPDNGKVTAVSSECKGTISFKPRGRGGFGYDPIFIPEGYSKTFAELSRDAKNRISHRARAFKKAKKILLDILSKQ
ncbi:MAG: RdgB/HAM1 family non-canonical purine NTP pyrophosphatase [bacterium]|nr:RdgB/HAM1 family non-canonical purine NTP pyrophosphatase [bacterium]